ncbi:MAG: chromophore lyase, partial [Cyclobacteriaceae bacterium]
HECHEESANHKALTWSKDEFNEKAILCGICKRELTINEYLGSSNTCPNCSASFNPNCEKHYRLYFNIS